jgi:hypothetical protein
MIKSKGKKASLYLQDKDWNQITKEFENLLGNISKKSLPVVGY